MSSDAEIGLRRIANQLGKEWEQVATYLGFSQSEVQKIRIDGNNRGVDNAIFDMLSTWAKRQPKDCHLRVRRKKMREALVGAGRSDIAAQLSTGDTTG